MPPVSSPGLHERRGAGGRPEPDRAARVRFRRAVTLMLMTLVIPGSAQLVAGRKQVGRIAIRIWLVLLGVGLFVLLLGLVWHGFLYRLLESDLLLDLLRFTLMAAAVGWALLFIDAWRLGQPLTLVRNQRLGLVGLNGVLCFGVAGSLLFGAHIVSSGQVLLALFPDGAASAPTHGRYNVLLLGGDSGAGRFGLRPDSMTVASIDEDTGRTVLIGLPRNLSNFTFREGSVMEEQFPDGFDCKDCYLNGVATWAGDNKELFPKSKHPGIDATIEAIEGITDLKINYWVLVDLQGFKDVVNAVGGVTLNVRSRIPVGLPHEDYFHYIEPGRKKLNGHDTLWFARAREGSDDYSRMARQKCVLNAMLTQISPQSALRNFGAIARATKGMVQTNLPRDEIGTFIDLAAKSRGQKVSTLSLVPPMINTGNPDLDLIKDKVEQAIDRAEGKGGKPGKGRKQAGTNLTGGSLGNLRDGYAANESDDLAAAC
jgi:LCP family protein required for cell wall assembly